MMKNFGVNLSGRNLQVYTSVKGGTYVGTIGHKECFAFTGKKVVSNGSEWHEVKFISPKGKAWGWYKGISGVTLWKNKPYSTSTQAYCSCKGGRFKGSFKYYKVTRYTELLNLGGEYRATLQPGDLVIVDTNDTESGDSKHFHMRITGYESKSRGQMLCTCYGYR